MIEVSKFLSVPRSVAYASASDLLANTFRASPPPNHSSVTTTYTVNMNTVLVVVFDYPFGGGEAVKAFSRLDDALIYADSMEMDHDMSGSILELEVLQYYPCLIDHEK